MHRVGQNSAGWQIFSLDLPGVSLIRPKRFLDARGYFVETYLRSRFADAGLVYDFIQDNQAGSNAKGTLRGLHFQIPPFAQAKLMRVLRGRIFDVIVDLRSGSATFGKHIAIELTAEMGEQLLMPAGVAHGYCTLEDNTEVLYKVDNVYSPAHERGLHAFDPDLGIVWPVAPADAMLCERDRKWPRLRDLSLHYFEPSLAVNNSERT